MGRLMSVEREVKLAASPTFRMPPLDDLGDDVLVVPYDPARLETVYFDTSDLRLARWGISLRHRQGQGWTVKLPPEDDAVMLIRGEFEFPGEDLNSPSGEAVDLIRAYVRTATLGPVVKLRTIRRKTQLLDFDDHGLGEVVDDEVSVLAGRRIAARFRELEIEITEDTPAGLLDEVLRRLREAGAGATDPTTKYVRALGPLALEPPELRVRELRRDSTVAAVLSRALSRSAIHLMRSDVVMRLDADPEGVHQARVASRRMRSDLRTFRTALDPTWVEPLRAELRWLGTVLGEARDADVMLDRVRGRAETIPPPEAPGVAGVIEGLEHRRKEAHVALIEALRTDRYYALLDRVVEAAEAPGVLSDADVQARVIARDLLRGPWRHLRQAVRSAGKHPSDVELHTIRIRAKRVRYAADTLAQLMGRGARSFAEAAAGLQVVLGEHNDAVVAAAWLRAWAADHRSGDAAFAAGMLAGIERAAAIAARDHWRKAWKLLASAWEEL